MLGWLGVREVIAQHDVVNVKRAVHVAAAPGALQTMFRLRSAVSERRTRATVAGAAVLELPRFCLTSARRLFPYMAAAAWNGLPRHVTDAASKRQLLRHFER